MKHSKFTNSFGYKEEFSMDDYDAKSFEEIERLLKQGYKDKMQITEHLLFLNAIMDNTDNPMIMEQGQKLYNELSNLK